MVASLGKRIVCACLLTAGVAAGAAPSYPDCAGPEDPGPCFVKQAEPDESRLPTDGPAAWISGNRLVVTWVGKADSVRLSGGQLGEPLVKFGNGIHQTVIQSALAPQLRNHMSFLVTVDGKTTRDPHVIEVAGPAAAGPLIVSHRSSLTMSFEGTALKANVWLPSAYRQGQHYPVLYLADGGSALAEGVIELMEQDKIPGVIVVGIDYCAAGDTEPVCRHNNYLGKRSDPQTPAFLAYETALVRTIVPTVEARYGAPPSSGLRAVGGASDGGVWAASMGLRHPELFGTAFVLSPGLAPAAHPDGKPAARFYIGTGLFESVFRVNAVRVAEDLKARGASVTLKLYPSGHDPWMWAQAMREDVHEWLASQSWRP